MTDIDAEKLAGIGAKLWGIKGKSHTPKCLTETYSPDILAKDFVRVVKGAINIYN